MRQILPFLFFMAVSCSLFAQRVCGDSDYAIKVLNVPASALRGASISKSPSSTGGLQKVLGLQPETGVPAIITIPVVVHVLYNNVQENISDAQILSQIDVLNKDYRGANADKAKAPSYFSSLVADCGIEFRLATADPNGFATNGIIRKHTDIQMFGLDDRIKSSQVGGDNAWDRNKYLNIWIGNIAGGIVGYTSKPDCTADKDGVVIHYTAFGTIGSAAAPFQLGRTATHEIGHWLNLIHIWGDTYCGDDGVDDTPTQRSSNRGCPSGEKFTCGSTAHGDMYMNFMDLTDDACMYMFTPGQRERMRALFQTGGLRHAILSSNALSATALPAPSAASSQVSGTPGSMNVYPSPASASITVEISGGEVLSTRSIIIYNYLGQPVLTQTMESNRKLIDISQLKPGIYFIKPAGLAAGVMTKFIKN